MKFTKFIILLTILCSSAIPGIVFPQYFKDCGRAQEVGEGCILFNSNSGNRLLRSVEPIPVDGELFQVVGEEVECDLSWCVWDDVTSCFIVREIIECQPESLGCGYLGMWDWDCPSQRIWRQFDTDEFWVVGNPEAFPDPDTLHVYATMAQGYSACHPGLRGLHVLTFSSCNDSLTSLDNITWGRLKSLYDH